MSTSNDIQSTPRRFSALRRFFQEVPLLGWLTGALAAVLAEQFMGLGLAHLVDLPKIPVLFGFENALKKPELIPGTLLYVLLVYLAPTLLVSRLLETDTDIAESALHGHLPGTSFNTLSASPQGRPRPHSTRPALPERRVRPSVAILGRRGYFK